MPNPDIIIIISKTLHISFSVGALPLSNIFRLFFSLVRSLALIQVLELRISPIFRFQVFLNLLHPTFSSHPDSQISLLKRFCFIRIICSLQPNWFSSILLIIGFTPKLFTLFLIQSKLPIIIKIFVSAVVNLHFNFQLCLLLVS